MKQILITSTVLILAILLIRWILRKRVSKRLIYAMWLLVALRLLIPFQFGQSEYSVIAVSEKLEQQSSSIQQLEQTLGHPVGFAPMELPQTPSATQPSESVAPEPTEPQSTALTPRQVLTCLWIGGSLIMAGWFFTTNLMFLRKAKRNAVRCEDIVSNVPILVSANAATPCLAGLFRPVIYLTPNCAEDPQKRNHVLTHELTHLKHWDHVWAWLRCLCLCIYWFNPLVWIAAMVSKRDCELACDEAALKKLGDSQRIAYGKTLLDTVTHSSVHILQTATAMSETKKQLKERVNFIVRKPKNLWFAAIALIVAVTVTAGLVFTGCQQSAPEPTKPVATTPNAEKNDPPPNTVTTAPPSTENNNTKPTNPPDPPYIEPTPMPNPDPEVFATAQELISRFMWYWATDVCCSLEPVTIEDMSQYLTSQQKEFYRGQQRRITCCHTADEVLAHMDRVLDKSQQRADPTEKLFTDGEALYVIILPREYRSFSDVQIIDYSDSHITATAKNRDEDGIYAIAQFHIELTSSGAKITSVEFTDVPPCNHDFEVTTVPPYDTEGYDLHTCKKCGHYYMDNFTERILYID